MRSLGLDVDGPARWGGLPSSQAAGVFVVELDAPLPAAPMDHAALRRWLERVPSLQLDGERPTPAALAHRLASFWIPGEPLLYVGRTSRSLAARVAALYATELGHRRPHAGGHWLKTLQDLARLRLWWAETDAPEEYEDGLLVAFAGRLPDGTTHRPDGSTPLPWANLASPSGDVRDTGLRDALLSAEEGPARPTNVQRSEPSPAIRRRLPTSSGVTRAPRRSGSAAASAGVASPGTPPRDQPTHLTSDGVTALEAELARLRDVERPEVVERIKLARELGDLRENADYEAARREQSFLEGRIQEIERRLRTAVLISSGARSSIGLGSRVRFELEGEPGELTIVGSTESDPAAGRISAASPVGRALLGRRAGDDVMVTTPGATLRYHILEVG